MCNRTRNTLVKNKIFIINIKYAPFDEIEYEYRWIKSH